MINGFLAFVCQLRSRALNWWIRFFLLHVSRVLLLLLVSDLFPFTDNKRRRRKDRPGWSVFLSKWHLLYGFKKCFFPCLNIIFRCLYYLCHGSIFFFNTKITATRWWIHLELSELTSYDSIPETQFHLPSLVKLPVVLNFTGASSICVWCEQSLHRAKVHGR